MKITGIDILPFGWETAPWNTGMGKGVGGTKTLGLLSLYTDEGITGNSIVGSFAAGVEQFAPTIVRDLYPLIHQRDPQLNEILWRDMWKHNRYMQSQCVSYIDIALWDIKGKKASLPIHNMRGTSRSKIPVYSSTAWHETPDDYYREAEIFTRKGWVAHKIHPHGIAKNDIEICKAVRKATGDELKLMLDVTWAYNYYDALTVGREIEELDFYWYEDPLPETDIYSYKKLKNSLTIPVVSTEAVPGKYFGMSQWLANSTTDMLRGDVGSLGGITPLIKTAHLAEGFNMNCEIFHGGNSVDAFANLHVMMAIRNCQFYEMFPPNGENQFGVIDDIQVDDWGFVHAPTNPGLGIKINWELINALKVDI